MPGTLTEFAMQTDSLIQHARDGDPQAQSKLVQIWYKRIYNFAFKFIGQHDQAMDITQKTFISMCRSLGGLQDLARFKPWLYKIAVNYCREEVRRAKAGKFVGFESVWNPEAEISPAWENSTRRHDNPESQLRYREVTDILQQALKQLNEDQREVVIMKEYEGMKFREIAEALNISENTVKSRMYYGLDALRKILESNDITRETLGYEF